MFLTIKASKSIKVTLLKDTNLKELIALKKAKEEN